ncbi:hypothetical protein D8674_042130 [Pyrus ussuriensis x Pyrus communis]|uniref:Uncharacterized protein n=1 Tax=Pyrus ussuriensis x Pyrus communis TaxID=2448454 RepID=A0A5N5FFC3_9ROSA|nr:hypothetical protein D8674_010171 [Pyrus ussuriensis x Pyrus communis]KAB2600571.1 hypothetical protein D8674_042130 [Pyrus ussuriensis x Pyrus communis]
MQQRSPCGDATRPLSVDLLTTPLAISFLSATATLLLLYPSFLLSPLSDNSAHTLKLSSRKGSATMSPER